MPSVQYKINRHTKKQEKTTHNEKKSKQLKPIQKWNR